MPTEPRDAITDATQSSEFITERLAFSNTWAPVSLRRAEGEGRLRQSDRENAPEAEIRVPLKAL